MNRNSDYDSCIEEGYQRKGDNPSGIPVNVIVVKQKPPPSGIDISLCMQGVPELSAYSTSYPKMYS